MDNQIFSCTAHLPGAPEQHFPARSDQTLLGSAEQALLAWPSSCRNGTCRTCIGQISQGSVHYTIAWPGLSYEEEAQGYVLPCVAYPAGDIVLHRTAL
jgi:ferredoxin